MTHPGQDTVQLLADAGAVLQPGFTGLTAPDQYTVKVKLATPAGWFMTFVVRQSAISNERVSHAAQR